MARFKKGQSGNPAGRPVGASNKVIRPIKEQLSDFLRDKLEELPAIWAKLSEKDKATLLKDLLPYFMPRLQVTKMDLEIDLLSETQLDELAFRLITTKTTER